MNENDKKSLIDRLNNKSFRIKRIFLELPNYSYFHSVLNKNGEDVNERFVGRKELIDKLKSFIYETTRNTGTYLVTGFRGMGKTSVVNKTLSELNPIAKSTNYFLIWVILLPIIIIHGKIKSAGYFIKLDFNQLFYLFVESTVLLSAFLYLGYRNIRRQQAIAFDRKDSDIFKLLFNPDYQKWLLNKISRLIYRSYESLMNPKFEKHKFSFHRILRFVLIYYLIVRIILIFFNDLFSENLGYESYYLFWFISYTIIISFIYVDLYDLLVSLLKERKKLSFKIAPKLTMEYKKLIALSIFFSLSLTYFIIYTLIKSNTIFFDKASWFLGLYLFIYLIIKYVIKRFTLENNKTSNSNYFSSLLPLINFFDFQHYLIVKVNLGKDNLTEKDVLKYITNELTRKYSRWHFNFKNIKRAFHLLGLFIFLYLIVSIFNFSVLGKNSTNFLNKSLFASSFFPSQAIITDNYDSEDLDQIYYYSNYILTIDEYINKIKQISCDSIIKSDLGYLNLLKDEKELVRENILSIPREIDTIIGIEYIKEYEYSEPSFIDKSIVLVAKITNQIDFLFVKTWYNIRRTVTRNFENYPIGSSGFTLLNFIYPTVPKLSVFMICFFIIVLSRFSPNRLILLKSHYHTIRDLKNLQKQISASIEVEKSGMANQFNNSIFNYLKRATYKPLESKDITQRLIHILNDISKISPIFGKIKVIFVFDELDKINTHYNNAISNLENEFDLGINEGQYLARRKERIGRILSSMKHFLNSGQAKFIFIAGREMYDAALAGISDRESSLDSIFNDNKLYVNSFYKENDTKVTDITKTTEEYLCQFLIPRQYLNNKNEEPTLKLYNEYLKDVEDEDLLPKEERVKIIENLKNFISYLTYRSNGVPRKLSNLIEQYVLKVCREDIKRVKGDSNDKIVVGYNDENLFLRISFYDQYKFSLISYLTSPIFLQLGNYIQEHSDKLLVSTSYLLDHLFKHHKFGISYRGLSLTPELVDVNKEPQFREFLDSMIELLSTSHLRPIVSGIYDYKFNNKIIAEIKMLSKIDDYEGAAFNFTLDESIELKRHFNRRLESLKKEQSTLIVNNQNSVNDDHINNVSLLHMMIGDLHFYDEEFQEAIIHYLDAVQIMRQKDIKTMPLYNFIIYVRNKLKLGLAYEKNKMFDNALMTFSELTDLIIRKRNIPLRKLGLAHFVIPRNLENMCENVFSNKNEFNKVKKYFEDFKDEKELVVVGRLKSEIIDKFENEKGGLDHNWKRLFPITDMVQFYSLNPKDVIKDINKLEVNYKPLKNNFLQSTIENVRLLYQPIIAKLFLIQKASPDKLKDIDIVRAIKEFNFIKLPLNTKEKRIIVAEFYNKLGDLLYIVNGTLNQRVKKEMLVIIDNPSAIIADKMNAQKLLFSPLDATLCYIKSLSILLNPIHRDESTNKSTEEIIEQSDDKSTEESRYKPEKINFLEYYSFNYKDSDDKELPSNIIKTFSTWVKKDNLEKVLDKIKTIVGNNSFKERYSVEYISSIANGIVDLSESLLSYLRNDIKTNPASPTNSINEYLNILYNNNNRETINPDYIFEKLDVGIIKIVELLKHSSILFESIGDYRVARYQRIKILFIIKNCSPNNRLELLKNADSFLDPNKKIEDFITDSIRLSYRAHKQNFNVDDQKIESFNLEGLSGLIKAESEVFINLYWLIVQEVLDSKEVLKNQKEFKAVFDVFKDVFKDVIKGFRNKVLNLKQGGVDPRARLEVAINKIVNPNTTVYTKFNRILSLYLLIGFNKNELVNLADNDINNRVYLILNSLGACNEIIKLHKLFDINYVTTNSLELAKIHKEMGDWCKRYQELKEDLRVPFLNDIVKERIIFSDSLNYINPNYHYGLSLDYNYKVKDFHTRGKAMKTFMKTRSYLDDLFNDDLIHFSLAIERNELHKIKSTDEFKFDYEVSELIKKLEKDNNEFKKRFLF